MIKREGLEPVRIRVLRPQERILSHAMIAALALFIPLFLVFYWLSIPRQTWPFVLEIQCGVTALGVIFALGVSKMTLRVAPDRLSVRSLLGRKTRVATADIDSLVLVELYQSESIDCLPYLYLLDSGGDVLVRLNGHVWSRQSLETVIDELGVTVLRPPDPFTAAELGRLRPQLVGRLTRHTAKLIG
ncbi:MULTISPECIES: hypothetical protein [unclassified Cryobacterium]|uniref:hypothetical protein n=1 Tax=unclassified Cryobacterium TaxID=2649013 RepID=UPI0011B0A2A7|nr:MULTISPECIES: hypothetical protein [unclassified Cryobacterium]